jgi:hypothetical protein
MGVRFSRAAIIQDWQARIHAVPGAVSKADFYLEQISATGEEEMKQYIASRGTSYSRSQGRAGRIESSAMYDAVSHRPNPNTSAFVFSWEFGWVNGFLSYFGFQERGFRHVGGASVEPMYALRDAATTARDKMLALGPKILRELSMLITGGR